MNIVDACRDENVFAPTFRDKRSWVPWMAFLAALFGLPLTPEQLALYRECTSCTKPPARASNEAWLICGRRAGKSYILALVSVFLAAFRDWRPYLGPGERASVVILASDRKQARTIMRYCKGLLHMVPMLRQLIANERSDGIDLDNRITIEVHTASFRTVRGYTIVAALLDEVAFWPQETASSPDTEVINAIRPAMATVPGAVLLAASSPYSQRGALFEAFKRHYGAEGDPILVWRSETRRMNPTVPQSFIDAEYEKDPMSAAAEYGAQFRQDIESFISREAVESCVNFRALEFPPLLGRKYQAFVDPSGGSNDSFTLAIAHRDEDMGVVDCLRERVPPFSPEAVVADFAALLKQYRCTRVVGDRFAGEWPREQFRKHGISYDPGASPKSDLYRDLLPLINSGGVKLLNNNRLIAQLVGLERRTSRAGRDSIDHAPGGHDDVANAVAGALMLALAKKPAMRTGVVAMGPGLSGKLTWKDPEEPTRVRVVRISEQEALRQKAEGTW